VRQAAAGADAAASAWLDAARAASRQPSPDWARLAPLAAKTKERSEAFNGLAAGDVLRQREEAGAAALEAVRWIWAATAAALLFGWAMAARLARRVAGPIAAASRAASGIAAGRLDTALSPKRAAANSARCSGPWAACATSWRPTPRAKGPKRPTRGRGWPRLWTFPWTASC
jgi:hypothetical protein